MNDYTGKQIAIIHRKSQIYWNRQLKKYNICASEFPIIIHLYDNDGITQDEIAAALSIDKSAITRIIRSLLEKGFIKKEKDEADLRCNRIYLMPSAVSLKEALLKIRESINMLLLKNMTSKEKADFTRLLKIAAENIQITEEYKE